MGRQLVERSTDFELEPVEVAVDWEPELLDRVQAELDARTGRMESVWLDSFGQVIGTKVTVGGRVRFYDTEGNLLARFGAA